MKAVTLSFHDAVVSGNFAASGFTEEGANHYKLDLEDMRRHFGAISASAWREPGSVHTLLSEPADQTQLFLAFDDGGVSAHEHIAPLLESFGWVGHFFITGDRIDMPGFVSREQIHELHGRGHVIGSHSWTHPRRMAKCSRAELLDEWRRSLDTLAEILGEATRTASVPGGYYSSAVARAASDCGVRALFTSEPVRRVWRVGETLVLGRYTLMRGVAPAISSGLASERLSAAQLKQLLLWNSKKLVKSAAGRPYLLLRERLLEAKESAGL